MRALLPSSNQIGSNQKRMGASIFFELKVLKFVSGIFRIFQGSKMYFRGRWTSVGRPTESVTSDRRPTDVRRTSVGSFYYCRGGRGVL